MRPAPFLLAFLAGGTAAAEGLDQHVLVHGTAASAGDFRTLTGVDAEFAVSLGTAEVGARLTVLVGRQPGPDAIHLVGRWGAHAGPAWLFGELGAGALRVDVTNAELDMAGPLAFSALAAAGIRLNLGPFSAETALETLLATHTTTIHASELGMPPERDRPALFTGLRLGIGLDF